MTERTVLVTGAMGFVGSHLCEALIERGDRVLALDNLSTGRLDNVAHLVDHPRFKTVIADVEDRMVLDRLVSESDLVIHLAAVVGVELIVADPIRNLETNIRGTSAVLEAAERYRVKTMIASTSEVYGKSEALPFKETGDVTLGPTSLSRWSYAASKMVDEFLGLAYHEHRGLPVVVFRLFNTVGPRQTGRYGMVVPRFVQAAMEERPIPVYGDGQQSRCFLHVADAINAILALADRPEALGQVYNVGSTELVTIEQLAERVLERVDKWRDSMSSVPPEQRMVRIPYSEAYGRGYEDMRSRKPDTSKLATLTGWCTQRTLDDTLDDVIHHYASTDAR
jgi:UDP-glucose 4-epimerase